MEGYGLEELAASADAVLAGLGPLAAGLARLALAAGQAVTLAEMELLAGEQGREILRGLVQLSLDMQAAAEVRQAVVTGADGVPRTRAERGHAPDGGDDAGRGDRAADRLPVRGQGRGVAVPA